VSDAVLVAGDAAPPGPRPTEEVALDLARVRLEPHQAAARQHEAPAPAVDGRQHGAGVARQFVSNPVHHFAGALLERNNPAAVALQFVEFQLVAARRTAADLRNQEITFDHGRTADAEEILDDAEFGDGVHLPERLAALHVH